MADGLSDASLIYLLKKLSFAKAHPCANAIPHWNLCWLDEER